MLIILPLKNDQIENLGLAVESLKEQWRRHNEGIDATIFIMGDFNLSPREDVFRRQFLGKPPKAFRCIEPTQ